VKTPDFTFPVYTDIDSLRKYGHWLFEGEEVVLSEKIHGSNCRVTYNKKKLWVGSHYQFKGRNDQDVFWQAAFKADLENKLKKIPGIALYGEVYGRVQKGFGYDCPGGAKVRFFDAMDLKTLRYLDYDDFAKICKDLDLETVPVLYRGPWNKDLKKLSEGNSTIGKHIREGFVVKPVKERCEIVGRIIFKLVGEAYLLKKE